MPGWVKSNSVGKKDLDQSEVGSAKIREGRMLHSVTQLLQVMLVSLGLRLKNEKVTVWHNVSWLSVTYFY